MRDNITEQKIIENKKIRINIEKCTKCKACAEECSFYLFESDALHLIDGFEDLCFECGHCVAICPVNIITLKSHPSENIMDVPLKENIPTFDTLINLFRTRRSRRQFLEKPVPKELIEKILNWAGRYSATAHNQENVYFTVVQSRELLTKLSDECSLQVSNLVRKFETPEGRQSLEKVFPESLMKAIEEAIPSFKRKLTRIEKGKEVWRWNAELIIVHSPKDSSSLIENCTLAAGQIMLAAETLGLGTCSLGYITAFLNQFKTVSKIPKIPRKHAVGYSLAIGYPKAKYLRIPSRKPLKANWL